MDEVTTGLAKIAKGAVIIGTGLIIGRILMFLSRVLLARGLSPEEYGVYVLITMIISIGSTLSLLGLNEGIPRFIGYYKKRNQKLLEIIYATIIISVITACVISSVILFEAEKIAIIFLHKGDYKIYITLSALGIVLLSLMNILSSVLRGLEKPREVSLITNIGVPLSILLIIVISILTKEGLTLVITGIITTYLVGSLLYLFIVKKDITRFTKKTIEKKKKRDIKNVIREGKKIVLFSLPLGFSSIMWLILTWTDTIILGYYYGSTTIGIYNVAVVVAKQFSVLLAISAFIYTPFCSQIYSKNKIESVKKIYQTTTKWLLIGAYPLFVLYFVFSRETIMYLFGLKYINAATPLFILGIAFFIHTILGLNAYTLIVTGDTYFIAMSNLASTINNIVLNLLMIPKYGIEGAAASTGMSLVILNFLLSIRLYQTTRTHPFTKEYIKTLLWGLIGLLCVLLIKRISLPYTNELFNMIINLVIFTIVFISGIIYARILNDEEIIIIKSIYKKLKISVKGENNEKSR